MKTNKRTKYAVIVLAVIFIITAALLILELWERHNDQFSPVDSGDGTLTYEGNDYVPKTGIETFLVLGVDKFHGSATADSHESGVQTDFIMVLVFDNEAETFTALSINRDTMVSVNKLAIGGVKVDTFTKQIALAYNYVADDNDKIRCRNTKDSVETLLKGIKIDHYLSLTMDSVAIMNDFVGGVELTVLDDFSGIDDTLIQGEQVTLTGEQALNYVRSRYGLENSDNISRMMRQKQYINALYEKTASLANNDAEFTVRLVDAMDEYVVYDSSDKKMQQFAEKFDEYEFLGIKEIEGESKEGEEFMEFYPDDDSIMKNVIDLFYIQKK